MNHPSPSPSSPEEPSTTPVDRFLQRLKSRPSVAALIALSTLVIALASFTDSAGKLWSLVKRKSPEDARAELARISVEYAPGVFLLKAREGDATAVRLFLAAGMDPNSTNYDGASALALAASQSRLEAVKALLEGKADVNFRYWKNGATALVSAAYRGASAEVLRLLIDKGADDLSITDAAHAAAQRGQAQALQVLLEAKPQAATARDSDGNTLFMDAVRSGDMATIKLVPQAAAQARDKGAKGVTALHLAAEGGHDDMIRFLLDAGADPNAKDDAGIAPLQLAAHDGRTIAAQMLLDAGAEVNARCVCPDLNGGGTTALIDAAHYARTETVALLLRRGADPKLASNDGTTALLLGADSCTTGGGKELVRLLLDHGAEVNVRHGDAGITALMQAQRLPCYGISGLLLERGAEPNAKNRAGWTAAMIALQGGSVDALRVLVEGGARLAPDTPMPDGVTPRQWIDRAKGVDKAALLALLERARPP